MAKKFFYVCAGLLMLAIAYHLGAGTATAQAPSNSVVAAQGGAGGVSTVWTANGDVYVSDNPASTAPWLRKSNVFSGGATPTAMQSWGALKAKYR